MKVRNEWVSEREREKLYEKERVRRSRGFRGEIVWEGGFFSE